MDGFTTTLQLLVAYGSLGLLIWAFIDATRFTKADFTTVDKMGRTFWLIGIGFALVLLLWLGSWRPDEPFGPRSLTWMAGLLLIGVYFYDLRPKLKQARAQRKMAGARSAKASRSSTKSGHR